MGSSLSRPMSDPRSYQSSPPPAFGRALLPFFLLDPTYVNLNHGSFGSLPIPVRDASNALSDAFETNPDLYLRVKYQPMLIAARTRLAALLGVADADEVVLLPNASHGLNNVLRSFDWNHGDVVVVCNTTYGSIGRTAQFIRDVPPHPEVSQFEIDFPTTRGEIVERWRRHLGEVRANAGQARVVAVVDGIISNPGCLLPWEEMVAVCREFDVWSVVDAAHVVGQQVDIRLDQTKPDFWISNCHKWLFAKRAAAVMYVPKRNQHIIRTTFPTSHAYISPQDRKDGAYNFVEQFEWNGTIDFSPYLTVPDALAFREWLGGEHKINEYNRNLALEGGKKLAEIMGTSLMDESGEFTLSMVNVELPIPARFNYPEMGPMFIQKLLVERNMFGAQYYHNERWWTRCSAQVFNELSDFEKFGHALKEVCAEIVDELTKMKGLEESVRQLYVKA